MKLIEFSIRRPVTITILVTVVLILGIFHLFASICRSVSDMEIPVVAVISSYSGAGPQEVKTRSLSCWKAP